MNPDHTREYWSSINAACNTRPALELTRSRIWLRHSTAFLLAAIIFAAGAMSATWLILGCIAP